MPRRAAAVLAATVMLAAPFPAASAVRLVDRAAGSGLSFTHSFGGGRLANLVETTGAGVCVLDLEGDSDADLYLVNGGNLRGGDLGPRVPNGVFRNDGGRFTDVTAASGAGGHGFGMGCAVADVDSDGDDDVLVLNFGADELFRNDGTGRFSEVAQAAGLSDARWTTAAAFADFDGDADLDLYVGGYVEHPLDGRTCPGPGDLRILCRPFDYAGIPGRLYRNDGPGPSGVPHFADVTTASGAKEPVGKTLAVLFEDLTGDGRPDLLLANDTVRNTFLVNLGGGRFRDATLASGTGFSDRGLPEASMGLEAGDLDGDGRLDLVVTNFRLETNTLLRGTSPGRFVNVTDSSGVGEATLPFLAFGVGLADLDLDGDLDLLFANGHVDDQVSAYDARATWRQPVQVLVNQSRPGLLRFEDVTAAAVGAPPTVGRGLALLDVEGDGDLDAVVSSCGGAPLLLVNETEREGRHFLRVRTEGLTPNTSGVGALVTAVALGRIQSRRVRAGASFASCSTRDAHFGLAAANSAEVTVTWPDGTVQACGTLAADRLHVVRQPGLGSRAAPRVLPATEPAAAASGAPRQDEAPLPYRLRSGAKP